MNQQPVRYVGFDLSVQGMLRLAVLSTGQVALLFYTDSSGTGDEILGVEQRPDKPGTQRHSISTHNTVELAIWKGSWV